MMGNVKRACAPEGTSSRRRETANGHRTAQLIKYLKSASSRSASEIVKKFVADNSDREVLQTIRELSRQCRQRNGDYYLATVASMIKQSTGLQVGPPEAVVRKIVNDSTCREPAKDKTDQKHISSDGGYRR